jgi:hypothetical protein
LLSAFHTLKHESIEGVANRFQQDHLPPPTPSAKGKEKLREVTLQISSRSSFDKIYRYLDSGDLNKGLPI